MLNKKKRLFVVSEFKIDSDWYKSQNLDASLDVQRGEASSFEDHFLNIGEDRLYSPSPYFCSSYYARVSAFNSRAPSWGIVEDYFRFGVESLLSPHWLFDEKFFLALNPKVKQARDCGNIVSGYHYFIRNIAQNPDISRPSPLFNQDYYLSQLSRRVEKDSFYDFIVNGQPQGISCSPLFDLQWYTSRYPSLRVSKDSTGSHSLLQHFLEFGIFEDKISFPDFDREYYLKTNPDVMEANSKGLSAIQHFLLQGMAEGRSPNEYFDTTYYLNTNPEVKKELIEGRYLGPFEHYLAVGIKRNLRAKPPLVSVLVNEDLAKSLYEKRCRLHSSTVRNGNHIRFKTIENAKLSIIIPVNDHFDFTLNLLRNLEPIVANNVELRVEVIVVDNGSVDDTKSLSQFVSGIKIIRHQNKLGYPEACNLGAKSSSGEILLFVNNDIEVTSGSLERVLEVFAQSADIGAVGGKVIRMNGQLQEAGSIIWRDGSTLGYGRDEDPLSPKYQFQRDVDYCSGCFLAVKRALFDRLGQFDLDYSPGYYEEVDLCARIWETGNRVVYDPKISIFHYEYASYSKGRPRTVTYSLMAKHREKFARKHSKFLSSKLFFEKKDISSAANLSRRTVRRVLLIEDLVPSLEIGSGFSRSATVVQEFIKRGWWVTIWANEKHAEIVPPSATLCEVIYGSEYLGGLEQFLSDEADTIDLLWLCRTHNLNNFSEIINRWHDQYPNARVLCDTEAVSSIRDWLKKQITISHIVTFTELEGEVLSGRLVEEFRGKEVANLFVAVNEMDSSMIKKISDCKVNLLGFCLGSRVTPKTFSERKDLLFCGAVHQTSSPNYDSLLWFVNKIMPLLKRSMPELKLKIIGYWRSTIPVPDALKGEGVEFIGPVKDLEPYFNNARLFIAPTRFAAGIPHKVYESMSFGLPTVVTPILARQIGNELPTTKLPFRASVDFSAEAFAKAVQSVYLDKTEWESIKTTGLDLVEKSCREQKFSDDFDNILATIMGPAK